MAASSKPFIFLILYMYSRISVLLEYLSAISQRVSPGFTEICWYVGDTLSAAAVHIPAHIAARIKKSKMTVNLFLFLSRYVLFITTTSFNSKLISLQRLHRLKLFIANYYMNICSVTILSNVCSFVNMFSNICLTF